MITITFQRVIQFGLFLAFLKFLSHNLYASDQYEIYQHPSLPIEFKAPAGWQQISHPEDELIFEARSPDSVIHVILWYTETEQDAPHYLRKMANMKDLVPEEEPQEIEIDEHSGWILRVLGYENKIPIRAMLVVIHNGKLIKRPKENKLYIVQLWCPEKQFSKQQNIMEDILKSIKVNGNRNKLN